jgi:hypothetical protein
MYQEATRKVKLNELSPFILDTHNKILCQSSNIWEDPQFYSARN